MPLPAEPGSGPLAWTARADRDALRAAEVQAVEWPDVRAALQAGRAAAARGRTDLADPADHFLSPLVRAEAVALLGVRLRDADDVHALHAVVTHLLRHDVAVMVEGPALDELDPLTFVEPPFDHPYTLERLRWLAERAAIAPPARFTGRHVPDGDRGRLDPEQDAAAGAPSGVVQVLAPAGSGKTTVLVERVRELLARGAAPERILVMTFNADARRELDERLRAARAPVPARTFHQTGFAIRRDIFEGRSILKGLTVPQWARHARAAAADIRVDPLIVQPELLPHWVEHVKLAELATAAEWREGLARLTDEQRLIAAVYARYEGEKEREHQLDFADMIFHAVRRLRADAQFRQRHQARYDHVLVDEYQDIEPAQELLVRILAAPQDSLFCVGDEDQTLYGWRRASVKRILDLDLAYPGLHRVALATNYRCPPEIVQASATLIARNKVRFPKRIRAAAGRPPGGERAVRLFAVDDEEAAARLVAQKLAGHGREQIVVLARTVHALRPVAYAAASRGLKIAGPEELFQSGGALRILEAYFSAFAEPKVAREEDVAQILRRPQRVTDMQAPGEVTRELHKGARWADAVGALAGASDRRAWQVQRAAGDLAGLARERADAGVFLAKLRAQGLDDHLRRADAAAGAPDRDEIAVLDEARSEAAGKTTAEYARLLAERASILRQARDERAGIELTTIHRAKGREWPRVLVFRCDEGLLPHAKALDTTPSEEAAGEGLEAERRLMYVGMTRAREELSLLYTKPRPSRFLFEAGLLDGDPGYLAGEARPEPSRSEGFWRRERQAPRQAAHSVQKRSRPPVDPNGVRVGDRFTIVNLDTGEAKTWQLVSRDGDPVRGLLSAQSAVGRAVLGRPPGAEVTVTTPAKGVVRYRIAQVDRGPPA